MKYTQHIPVTQIVLLTILSICVSNQTFSQDTTPSVTVTRVTDRITVDGNLDEAMWSQAPKIGELVQRQPDTGQAPTEQTEVTLLYDANNLYVGITAFDSEPDKVIGTVMERDGSLRSDDSIEIILDTFRTQQNAFYFATNPAGAFVDGLAYDNQELNTDWNAIWEVRTKRTDSGWVAEIAIPFKSLNFPEESNQWGFNIERNIIRKLEQSRWSGARLETDFLQISEAGRITNLQGLNQGIGLDIRPFVAASWLDSDTSSDDGFDAEPGVDISYNFFFIVNVT